MKKRIRKCIASVLVSLLVASSGFGSIGTLWVNADGGESYVDEFGIYHGEVESTVMWEIPKKEDPYTQHRIPGIVVTKEDTVIVYCEARDTRDTKGSAGANGDWSRMDIIVQRSEDGGRTFGDPIYIAKGGEGKYGITVNNPVMIVGQDNTLHMLFCSDYGIKEKGDMYYTRSEDDGKTWSEPRSVMTEEINRKFNCIAFGPTHGICTEDGILATAMWAVTDMPGKEESSHAGNASYIFYSADNGETWQMAEGRMSENCDETTLAVLSDGSVMANSRDSRNNSKLRAVTVCEDFDPTRKLEWSRTEYPEELIDPTCCGSILTVNKEGLPFMLLFVNCDSQKARERVMVKCSFDDGETYEKQLLINPMGGGYSDIAVDSTGKAYVLWEINYGEMVKLTTFSLADEFVDEEVLFKLQEEILAEREAERIAKEEAEALAESEALAARNKKIAAVAGSVIAGAVAAGGVVVFICRARRKKSTTDK